MPVVGTQLNGIVTLSRLGDIESDTTCIDTVISISMFAFDIEGYNVMTLYG